MHITTSRTSRKETVIINLNKLYDHYNCNTATPRDPTGLCKVITVLSRKSHRK